MERKAERSLYSPTQPEGEKKPGFFKGVLAIFFIWNALTLMWFKSIHPLHGDISGVGTLMPMVFGAISFVLAHCFLLVAGGIVVWWEKKRQAHEKKCDRAASFILSALSIPTLWMYWNVLWFVLGPKNY